VVPRSAGRLIVYFFLRCVSAPFRRAENFPADRGFDSSSSPLVDCPRQIGDQVSTELSAYRPGSWQ